MQRRYRHAIVLAAGVIGMAVAGLLPVPRAQGETGFDRAWDLCGTATRQIEREKRIPKHLLGAISLAESGRWDNINHRSAAWPWTVTSGTDTWMLDNKSDAIRQVEALRAEGRTNIDVGCMQINLHFHPDAFATLDQAFDPVVNARYAGDFLANLQAATRNWLTAAGNYHSRTPEFHDRYKSKVTRLWKERRNSGPEPATDTPAPAAEIQTARLDPAVTGDTTLRETRIAPIDHERTARLNDAFRNRQTTDSANGQQFGSLRSAGRTTSLFGGNGYVLNAQAQRARKLAEQRQQIDARIKAEQRADSTSGINPDLQLWRNLYRTGQ